MDCRASGRSVKGDLAPDDRPHHAVPDEFQNASMDPLAVSVRREVVAGHRLEGRGVVDVGVAHPEEGEVPEEDRPRDDPFVLGFDAGGEPDQEVPAVERHAPEGLGRHLTTDASKATSTPRPSVASQHRGDEVGSM